MFVVLTILVRTVDVDEKLNGPAVIAKFPCQIVLNNATPALRQFLLDRLSSTDDWEDVGVVVRLKQCETLAIVESTIKVDGLVLGVGPVKNSEKLSKDTAGGVAVFETTNR